MHQFGFGGILGANGSPVPCRGAMNVFISYSKDQSSALQDLVAQMQLVQPNVTFLYDQAEDRGTESWWNQIKRDILSSKIFLLLLSEEWLSSQWNRREYSLARKAEKRILTVKISPTVRVPSALRSGQVFDLSQGMQHSPDADELFAALGIIPGAQIDTEAARPMSVDPLPFDDLNATTPKGADQVPDDLLAPGVPLGSATAAATSNTTSPPVTPHIGAAISDFFRKLPLFSIITLLMFAAVIVGIVLIGLDFTDVGLAVLLGGVVVGIILSLIVFIQRRSDEGA